MSREHNRATHTPAAVPEGTPAYIAFALEGLVNKIAQGGAVVYVGAGVSESAGMLSWKKLLNRLQADATGRLKIQGAEAQEYFDDLKTRSRNLEIADWLEKLLKGEFESTISEVFSKCEDSRKMEPSIIHWNLVRLPFTMAITTNYDQLFKAAYDAAFRVRDETITPITWKQTPDILRAVNKNSFRIIHAHGIAGDNDSIILSGSQYEALQQTKPNFGEVLKWLLKTKTFLFVGAGLQDPDLIFQLQQAVSEHRDAVGPHYALLPYREAPPLRRQILRETLNVVLIPVGSKEIEKSGKDWMTTATARSLRDLSGKVADCRLNPYIARLPTSDNASFCLNGSLRQLLKHAIEITGSYRGDFCLSPDGLASHLSGELRYEIVEGPTDPNIQGQEVKADSVCGIAYYQATAEHGVYVEDVHQEHIAESSQLGHFGKIRYVRGDRKVKSELAMPVEADGVRIGVLNLESNIVDAYSPDHISVARRFAEKAARLYSAAHERKKRGDRLDAKKIEPSYQAMRLICERLWRVARGPEKSGARLELALLVYQANYIKGRLIAQNLNNTVLQGLETKRIKAPDFDFHDEANKNRYLATRVFLNGRAYAYPDAEEAIDAGKLTVEHQDELGLTGHVIGFPVLVSGHIAGVITAWDRGPDKVQLDGRDIELFRRAFHLMANSFDLPALATTDGPLTAADLHPSEANAGVAIHKVNRIIDCISTPAPRTQETTAALLNEVGIHFHKAVGNTLSEFLAELNRQDWDFVQRMGETAPEAVKPTSWITPKRARCWIRIKSSEDDEPRFLLALQVSLDPDDPPKNTYSHESGTYGIAMQPFLRREPGREKQARRIKPEPQQIYSDLPGNARTAKVHINGFDPVESLIYDDNPHLSFLLSRISAYPFSFQQRPNIVGNDVMSEVLEKDPNLPWLVAPLIVGSEHRWRETGPPPEQDTGADAMPVSEKCLAAYVTFDNGRYRKGEPGAASDHPQIAGKWADFRNDVLHQIALFGACLACNPAFSSLVSEQEPEAFRAHG